MKKMLPVLFALLLLIAVGCGKGEKQSKGDTTNTKESVKETSPETGCDPEKAICQNRNTGVYYKNLTEALKAVKDGETILMLKDNNKSLTVEDDAPAYIVDYNGKEPPFKASGGCLMENGDSYIMFAHPESLTGSGEYGGRVVWILKDYDTVEKGRYYITGENILLRIGDRSDFGKETVCRNETKGIGFVSVSYAVSSAGEGDRLVLSVVPAEPMSVTVGNEADFTLTAVGNPVISYTRGVSFRDGENYCYFSSAGAGIDAMSETVTTYWLWEGDGAGLYERGENGFTRISSLDGWRTEGFVCEMGNKKYRSLADALLSSDGKNGITLLCGNSESVDYTEKNYRISENGHTLANPPDTPEGITEDENGRTFYSDAAVFFDDSEQLGRFIWLFRETDGYPAGRYLLTEQGKAERLEDISLYGGPVLCSVKGKPFYDLQVALDHLSAEENYIILESDLSGGDFYDLTVKKDGGSYNLSYNYKTANLRFNYGVTYDDGKGGYCYYSSLDALFAIDGLSDTFLWIWTESEGYKPGYYRITGEAGSYETERIDSLDVWGTV